MVDTVVITVVSTVGVVCTVIRTYCIFLLWWECYLIESTTSVGVGVVPVASLIRTVELYIFAFVFLART